MNPDSPQSPREELEMRLTALLLGELPDAEAAALRETLAHDPELARLHDRLAATLGLIREATPLSAAAEAAKPEPLTLDPQRRETLRKLFQQPSDKIVRPAVPFWTQKRRELVQVAAMIAALLTVTGMVLLSITRREFAREDTLEGEDMPRGTRVAWAFRRVFSLGNELSSPVLMEKVGEPPAASLERKQDNREDTIINADAGDMIAAVRAGGLGTTTNAVTAMGGSRDSGVASYTVRLKNGADQRTLTVVPDEAISHGEKQQNLVHRSIPPLSEERGAGLSSYASSYTPNSQPAPESKLPDKIAAELRKAEAPPVPPKPAQVAVIRAGGRIQAENIPSISAKEKPVALGLDMVTDLAASTDGGGRKPGEAPAKPKELAQLQDRELPIPSTRASIALPESSVAESLAVERKRVDTAGVAEPVLRAKTAIALPEPAAAEGIIMERKQAGKEALGKDMVALGNPVHWTESGRLSSGGMAGGGGGMGGGGGGARGPQAPTSPAPNSGVTTHDLFAAYDSAPSNRGLASAADSPVDAKKDAKQLADGTAASSVRDLGERGRTMNLTGLAVDAPTMPADGVTLAGRVDQNKAPVLGDLPVAGRLFQNESKLGALAAEKSRKTGAEPSQLAGGAGGQPAAGQINNFGVNKSENGYLTPGLDITAGPMQLDDANYRGVAVAKTLPHESIEHLYFDGRGGDAEAKQKANVAGPSDGEKFYFDANRNAQVEFGREAKWAGVLQNPTPGGAPNQGVPASSEAKGERAGRALAGLELAKAKAEPAPTVDFDADAPVKRPTPLPEIVRSYDGTAKQDGFNLDAVSVTPQGNPSESNIRLFRMRGPVGSGAEAAKQSLPDLVAGNTFSVAQRATNWADNGGAIVYLRTNQMVSPENVNSWGFRTNDPEGHGTFVNGTVASSSGGFHGDYVVVPSTPEAAKSLNYSLFAEVPAQPESAKRTEELAKGLKAESPMKSVPSRTMRLPPAPAATQPSFAGRPEKDLRDRSQIEPSGIPPQGGTMVNDPQAQDFAKLTARPGSDTNGSEAEHETLRRELNRGTTVAKAQKQLVDNLGELNKDRPDSTAQRLSETDKKLGAVGLTSEDVGGLRQLYPPADNLARLSREKQSAAPEGKPAASTGTLVQDGKLLFEMRDFDDAEGKLKEALTQDPDNKAAYYYLSLIQEARYGDEAKKRDFAQKTRLMEAEKALPALSAKLYVNSAGNDGLTDTNRTIGDPATMKSGVAVGQLEGPRRITNTVVRADGNGGWTTNVETVWGYEFGKSQKDRAGAATGVEKAPAKIEKSKTPPPPPATPPPSAPVPQPEISATANAFSTFSLNVSDVSFKLAAASLEKGVMPDVTTLRAEEFLNALDYHDPEPTGGARLAFAWERARDPFAHDRDYLRFSVKTAASGRQAGRPLNLVLLLDNSGSMERADRVLIRQECLRVLAGQLQAGDRVSVIAFARTARLFIDGLAGEQAAELPNRVGELSPEGGTNLEDAMNLAWRTAARHYLPNGMNRVVLLTDGAANLGDVDPASLKKQVEAQRKQGMALDCFGIGWDGYNDDLLEALSRNGDGRYGFINTPEAAAHDFAGQLAGALKIAASDVKVQVEWNPRRVTVWRQIGYAKHQLKKEEFRDNKVDAAEIAAQEAGNALYTVQVNPAGEGPLGVVRVRYKIPGTTDYREHEWPVPYEGAARPLEQSSDAMRLAATSSAFSEWLASSPFAGEVTPDGLLGYLNGVPERYAADPRPKQLEAMIRQARSLVGK